ncbi:MAG: carboxypeptidase-like regulatory domain-containing protein [Bacteroides sp.]|nr:carboxypeptidase-like regulatory domain-containing protein [Bacteroides sp.]
MFFIYSLFSVLVAQSYTISGTIRDAIARETLIGATILEGISGKGTTSNSYGFYSLTLPRGEVEVRFSYIGYETESHPFTLNRDTTIQVLLKPAAQELQQIVVEAGNTPLRTTRTGTVTIPMDQLKNIPSLLGENDLMKSLQLLPGVQTTSEGKSDLSVRGGSPDQNLILLDGIPIYNANHLYGFLSVFNTDAIKNVTLYKSGFPARFGGRLSSVVDIHTNDENKERMEGSASVGLLAMKASIEGPLIKDKTSFTFSVRRTYLDLFMDKITDWIN